jgi:hypothetical protein
MFPQSPAAKETADRDWRLGKAAYAAEDFQKKAAYAAEQFQKTQLDIFAERILSETEKQAALGVKCFDVEVSDEEDMIRVGCLPCSASVLYNAPDLQDQLTMRGLKNLSVKLYDPLYEKFAEVAVENKAVAVGVENNKDESTIIERRPAAANKGRRHLNNTNNTGRAQLCALQ